MADIKLRLLDYTGPDFDELAEDTELASALTQMFKGRDPSYGIVLVDISDPTTPRWAGLRPDVKRNPGSVGKVVCMLALFNSLAKAFPDPDMRAAVLSTTMVRAGDWVVQGEHVVPRWLPQERRTNFAVIKPEESFLLSEWLDHAISASANGAGSVIWREAMLIEHFGSDYPVAQATADEFFKNTPKRELAELSWKVVEEPLRNAGINVDNMTQGSFWTRVSKQRVPGKQSYATPRELARFLFRLEQGKLVDKWSSLEMKRYMYLTKRRYRYSYAPELSPSAIFFKSGSLYQCQPEEGYRCGKYMGNKRNMMNSIAIVETPEPQRNYIVTLMSDVLKFNSAWDHSRIGAAIDKLMRTSTPVALQESATATEMQEAGKSD